MVGKRKRHSPEFKAKIALLAVKGEQSINEIASRYELHPGQVIQWKKQLLTQAPELFSSGSKRRGQAEEALRNQLTRRLVN